MSMDRGDRRRWETSRMDDREQKNQIQCIVDEGVLVNRRDIVRILRDLGTVRYLDIQDGTVVRTGEGYVASVVSSASSSTVIANKRLYLNVNSFEYLRLGVEADLPVFDLVDDKRTIRLIPSPDSAGERPAAQSEDETYGTGRLDRLFGDSLAEVYLDDEDDEEF